MVLEWFMGMTSRIVVGSLNIILAGAITAYYLSSQILHRRGKMGYLCFLHTYAFGILFIATIIDFLNLFSLIATGSLSRYLLFLFLILMLASASNVQKRGIARHARYVENNGSKRKNRNKKSRRH
ncbi:hypothetical protein J4210_01720 [Candidatus Woesearchaeota archaeon]|nr:hypothetical protein [Candidatus Woesearchaeota archaeon]